jgi:hypothetical protein
LDLNLRPARPEDRWACENIFAAVQLLAYPRQPPAASMPWDFEAATREEDLWVAQSGANIRG